MKTLFPPIYKHLPVDAGVLHESVRRQFWLSLAVLFALAFAAVGHVRPVVEAPAAAAGLRHPHVVTPTFVPPTAAPVRPPADWRVRVG